MPKALKTAILDAPALPATPSPLPRLALASGSEPGVRSPALELQEALEIMLAVPERRPSPRLTSAVALTLGGASVVGVCAAFWLTIARLVISAL